MNNNLTDGQIQYEIEMRVISFMTFIKVPLNSVTSVDLFNTFLNRVSKPEYIEERCTDVDCIAFIHSTIESYKNEDLFFRFDKDELLKYKPTPKRVKRAY